MADKIRPLFAVRPYHTQGKRTFPQKFVHCMERDRFAPLLLSGGDGLALDWFRERGIDTRIYPGLDSEASLPGLLELFREERIDLVHTEGYSFPLALAAQQARIPHIFGLGAVVEEGIRDFHPALRNHVLTAISQLSQAIVCPSRFVAAPLREIGARQATVIPNGVDLQQLQPRGEVMRGKHIVIAMVAHYLPQKRHGDFILAAQQVHQQMPQARFILFGESYPHRESLDYHQRILQLTQDLGLLPVVSFRQFGDRLQDDLAGVDLVTLPSVQEGFGIALVEAMAMGLPVVASDQGGIPEVVAAGETGLLVAPLNPSALAQALLELSRQPERARAMGRAGRARAERHFCLQRGIRQYQRLIEELLEGQPGPAR